LECGIDGTDVVKTWLYNNAPLWATAEIAWNTTSGTLEISTMRESYAGWYTCTAGKQTTRLEVDYLLIAGELSLSIYELLDILAITC